MTGTNDQRIISITGPSAAGKTTIVQRLLAECADLSIIPSYMTRSRRENDIFEECRYVSQEEFVRLEEQQTFLWTADVHGNHYGTSRISIDNALVSQNRSLIIAVPYVIPILMKYANDSVLPIYIQAPSPGELARRLRARGESKTQIERRIVDCLQWDEDVRESNIPYQYVTNDTTIEEAVAHVKNILYSTPK